MKIATVKIEFHHLPDFILSKEEYDKQGKFNGFCKENCINKSDVKKVHHIQLEENKYPTQEWEG
jgi:hypothetical protein